jgi:isocitrate dehydrogenase
VKENHLRWDSLGEFLALAVSLETLAEKDGNDRAAALAKALDAATGQVLENGRSPSRKVGELDNRGSHFYLALYWARALVEAGDDAYDRLARRLADQEEEITAELTEVQGAAVDLGGYYFVDREKADAVMRPSAAFNAAIDEV